MSMFSQYKYHITSFEAIFCYHVFISHSLNAFRLEWKQRTRHRLSFGSNGTTPSHFFALFLTLRHFTMWTHIRHSSQYHRLLKWTCTNKWESKSLQRHQNKRYTKKGHKLLHIFAYKIHMTEINFINLFESNCLKIQIDIYLCCLHLYEWERERELKWEWVAHWKGC